jgi:hypothetical protein
MIIELRYKSGQLVMDMDSVVDTPPVDFDIAHHEVLRHRLHDIPVIRSRQPDGTT